MVIPTYGVPHLRHLLPDPFCCIKPTVQIHTHNVEGVFELLNYHDQFTLNHSVDIWEESAFEEARNLSL